MCKGNNPLEFYQSFELRPLEFYQSFELRVELPGVSQIQVSVLESNVLVWTECESGKRVGVGVHVAL